MIDFISVMLSYPFVVRAVVVGVLVSLCASVLGVSLVLKRYSMIGDGLSHVGFGALAVTTAINMVLDLSMPPLAVSIPVVGLAAFLLLRLSENSKIKGDAAIALISTGALTVGIMAVSMTPGVNVDITSYLFGSILGVNKNDVPLVIAVSVVILILYVAFYPKIFSVTFDENFARSTGVKVELYNMLIALLTAVVIVLGMRLMGALLISALIIFPPLTSMRIFGSFKSVVLCSAVLSVLCFITGITVSYVLSAPAGASVVSVNIAVFLLLSGVKAIKEKMI